MTVYLQLRRGNTAALSHVTDRRDRHHAGSALSSISIWARAADDQCD
jgi:hypothetical protein